MKSDVDIMLEMLPPEAREGARAAWSGLPPDIRQELKHTLKSFVDIMRDRPSNAGDLLGMIRRLAAPVYSPVSRVAIVGPVNVGKSTLFNALVNETDVTAEVSPIPGTTRAPISSEKGLFALVDTPGADRALTMGLEERNSAFEAARKADFLILVFDATVGVNTSARVLYGELKALGKPYLVALNKIDMVSGKLRSEVVRSAAQVLDLDPEEIVPLSAQDGNGVDRLLLELAAAEPRLLGKLGELLVPMRRKLGWQAVRRAAVAAGIVALSPIPILDLLPLTAIQSTMVLTLAKIYGEKLNAKRGVEILAAFGAGMLGRTLFQQLTKLGGVPGWALSASVASSATIAIGYAVMRWFETGKKPSKKVMLEVAQEAQKALTTHLSGKKPGKKKLTEDLESLLPGVTQKLDEEE